MNENRERLERRLDRAIERGDETKIAAAERDLSLPPFPVGAEYIWRVYLRLRKRTGPGFDVMPITWEAIDAFLTRSGVTLSPWEIELIESIDDVYLRPPSKTEEPIKPKDVSEIASVADGSGIKAIMKAIGRRVVRVVKRNTDG